MAYPPVTSIAFYILVAYLIKITVINHLINAIAASKFKKLHGCRDPPRYPQTERLLGLSLLQEAKVAQKEYRALESGIERAARVGNTYSVTILGRALTVTLEPENLKAILSTNFKTFGLGERMHVFGALLGSGIFTSDGAHWEQSRALVRPNFTKQQVASLDTFETHVQHLLSRIPKDGRTVDLQVLFFNMTLDSATEFLFGESVNSQLSAEGGEAERFGHAFDYAQGQLMARHRWGRLAEWIPDRKFDEACKTVHAFCDMYVSKTLGARGPDEKSEKVDEKSGKERYIFLNEMAKATRDPKQLRDEMLNILLAGRDTTAGLLSNTFHALARHPKAWQKLKAEVDTLEGRLPDYECLKNMQYLKWVLNEALRLYPAVPGNARYANENTFLPCGGGPDGKSPAFIPKGGVVIYSVYAIHRRRDIYGPDADEFKPERWGPDAPGGPLRPGWGYLPFNGGPRICVGQQYGLTEAGYAIVRLLQTFDRIENRDPEPWREQLGLTLSSKDGTKVGLYWA